jgi:hypothetical protein
MSWDERKIEFIANISSKGYFTVFVSDKSKAMDTGRISSSFNIDKSFTFG